MILKKKTEYFFIAGIIISLISSFNINPHLFFKNEVTLSDLINNLNVITFVNLILFFAPTTLILIYLYKRKNFFSNIKNINFNILLLFSYFLLLFFKSKDTFIPENLYFLIYLNIFIFLISIIDHSQKEIVFIFIFSLIIYLSITILILIFKGGFNILDVRNSEFFSFNNSFLSNSMPRTTGFARILVFLFISIYYFKIFKLNFINTIILVLISFLIFSTQSRQGLILFIFLFFFINFFKDKFIFFKFIKDIIKYLILPFILLISINYTFIQFENKPNLKKDIIVNKPSTLDVIINQNRFLKFTKPNINKLEIEESKPLSEIENFTSGRNKIWSFVLNEFHNSSNKLFFGFGINSDKRYLNQSASNSFIYSMYSNGILGVFIYFVIILYNVFSFIKAIYRNELNKYNVFSYSIIFSLIIRSLVENSFLSNSVDLYLLILTSLIIKNNLYFSNFKLFS